MDPGRQAMINGWKSPSRSNRSNRSSRDRDITAPRHDPNSRISKLSRPPPSKASTTSNAARYLTQDEQSEQFIADEDKFVLKQAKKKADIRVREHRAKPIDYLAFNLRFIDTDRDVFDDNDADVEMEIPAPEAVLEGLDEAQLKELHEDIKSYHTLEINPRNKEYWTALLALCADRRQKLKPQGPEGRAVTSVATDVDRILSPKTYEQLEALEKQIRAKLQSNEPIDTDYWGELLKSLLVYKAKAQLKKLCQAIKEARVELLKTRDPERAKALESSDGLPRGMPKFGQSSGKAATRPVAASPATQNPSAPPPGTARFATTGDEDFSQATKAMYEREVARGVEENEEIFTAEEVVSGAKPQWAEKYRPRKPRYFNRVQMGYEWNKYNQTHYDHDNPPPKVVQGYKFNIFYPDLIDKTKAPTFKIVREHGRRRGESYAPAGEEDTCLIRFTAGPPYEDVAFRIVDREWDYSAKRDRGFRSSFDKGILQLHFQFKKVYYRK
ncbi:mid region of cactin-domain-containing protein [Diplogelasinospora grovesii]|uniref:Splicing factor Cactin n=1 Tax=Diplogelasinospora grovesii TaxID=303347 RepID=A0AAN6N431_9PEZI|nr:mid region of cactin-domain-containing protein [Diplogelasinospora grovesii]